MSKARTLLNVVTVGLIVLGISNAWADTYWNVSSGDWSVGGNWTAGVPTSGVNAWIINNGVVGIGQSGQVCNNLYVGNGYSPYGPIGTGGVALTAGDLTCSAEEYVGLFYPGAVAQTGGRNTFDNSTAGCLYVGFGAGADNSSYSLAGGSIGGFWEIVGYAASATFTQTGGVNAPQYLSVGSSGKAGTYQLQGGTLSVSGQVYIPDSPQTGTAGLLNQTGGACTVGYLLDGYASTQGEYRISGGSLNATYVDLGYNSPGNVGTFTVIGSQDNITVVVWNYNTPQCGGNVLNFQFDAQGISQIHVTNSAVIGGTLNVTDPNSDAPLGRFTVFTAGSLTGTFTTVNLPNSYWSWGIDTPTKSVWVQKGFLAVPASPNLFRVSYENTLNGADNQGAVAPAHVAGAYSFPSGVVGQALRCETDNATWMSYPVAGHVYSSHGTIAMWVKAEDWLETDGFFHIFFWTGGPSWIQLYKFYTGGLAMLAGSGLSPNYDAVVCNNGMMNDHQWHHLAGVWDCDQLSLYVDGVLKITKANPNSPPSPQTLTGYFDLGDYDWDYHPYGPRTSHTQLDEVNVYRYALAADQIARLAQLLPLTYQPHLELDISAGTYGQQFTVNLKAEGLVAGDGGTGTSATIQVLAADNTTVQTSGTISSFPEGRGSTVMNIASISTGSHVVRAILLDNASQEITRVDGQYVKPDWISGTVGMVDRVLAPFDNMTALSADNVTCWGRRYYLSGALPTQIQSAGQTLLADSGAYLTVTPQGSSAITLPPGSGTIDNASTTRVCLHGSASAGDFTVTTATSVEYDGMLWTDLTLTPGGSTSVSNVTLHIPVNAAQALYFHHACGNYTKDNATLLPGSGYTADPNAIQPYLWVGDDDRGLAWFAETQQGWSVDNNSTIQQIVRPDNSTVEMQIAFVNRSNTSLSSSAPLHVSFGLQATPVKPRPADARSWRLTGKDTAFHDLGHGNLEVLWPTGPDYYMKYFGYPWPADNDTNLAAHIASCHDNGTRVIVYVNLNYVSPYADDYAFYGSQWLQLPGYDYGDNTSLWWAKMACPNSTAWRDFIATKLAQFIDAYHFDGIYIDCWEPYICTVEDHDGLSSDHCGWRDTGGTLHSVVPLRGMREIVRRVREIFQDRVSNPHLLIHMSGAVVIPALAFADSMLDGEQYQAGGAGAPGPGDATDDYLNIVPLDKWRAENTGGHWGVAPFFLPEFVTGLGNPTPTQRLMGIMLAHDIGIMPTACNYPTVFTTWDIVKAFGIDNATFLPYWTSNGVTVTGDPLVVASAYQLPGKALLVILNSDNQTATVTVTVDGASLLGGPTWLAKDAVDNSSLTVTSQSFTLANLAGRNYRLIALTYNAPPTVSLTAPANNAAYIAPSSITSSASASDSDGTISKVEFYDNTTLLGTVMSSPYNYTWNSPPAGRHTLTAKAYDNNGFATTSSVVNISVWTTADINTSGGSASYSNGVYTITGKGAGIINSADAFRFVYLPMSDNCTISARITNVTGTLYTNGRVGVMIRQDTANGAKETSSLYRAYSTKTYFLHYRTTAGGSTGTSSLSANTSSPWWVRVIRSVNGGTQTFQAYKSADNLTWTQVGYNQSITMTNPVQVGLAVTSGNNSNTNTATIDNVSISPP